MNKKHIYKLLRYAALCGNTLYILWILFNAMDEGAKGVRPVEAVSLSGLIILLIINLILLSQKA